MKDFRHLISASAAVLAFALSATAHAQTADPQPAAGASEAPQTGGASSLEDIVVTARKTSENLQRAPASIVAVGGEELQNRGITDAISLGKILPSANLRTQGPVTQVFIRGIGSRTDLPNFQAASALLYNGVIIQRYGTFGLTYDLERVESIAGPQGTLYGGSAAGGAINLFSQAPKDDFSGYLQGIYGSYDTVQFTGGQNFAVSDTLSLRVAGDYKRRDSFYKNGLNSQNAWSGRASMLFKPTDNFSAHIFYTHGHDTGKPITNLVTNPPADPDHPFRLPATGAAGNPLNGRETYQDNRNDIVGANISLDVGDSTFTYIPAYVDFKAEYLYFSGAVGNKLFVYDRERQHSQELRWNGGLGPVKLTAGLFYLRNTTDFTDTQQRYTGPTTFTPVLLNITDQTNTSYAAFAQAILSVTDRLRITGGARYSRDKIVANGVGASGVRIAFDHAHSRPDYKLGVDYDLADHVLVYANLQSGYIGFGYNPDVGPTATNPQNPIVPESKLTAISGGFKSRLLDNRLEANVEGFHYLYKNFQAIQFVSATGLSTVLNAEKSTIYGVDINLRARITPSFSVYAALVLQHARYDNFAGVGYNFSGNQMINAPDVNFQGGIEKRFELAGGATLTARVDTQYEDGHYGAFNNLPTQRQDAFHRTDASLMYAPASDRWNVQIFVRNIENATVFTTINGGSATAAASGGLEPPRTFGGRLSIKW
ncbi:TonB-dependent receptor [Sphingobium nicotianae]|uniref:TonB-dependent receptor n=1 Tax=Sphingobium nicotianae TaxID=2782607 RepID=A0A9X1DEZ6_9SPHN|nr:TonB-dependent receptor [Sphingobium nicotianae]MBT2188649.1 TonB-dependent receptor [Sphingobium nicotianae]